MAKNSAYWQKRFEILETASNNYGQDCFMQIEPAFEQAQRQIEKEINAWYGRFAHNNKITIEEAKRLLNTKELKEFKWDVQEYIKYGHENDLNQLWMKELENASAKYHVSRLEALKLRTQQAAEVAFENELDEIDAMARKVYTENYYHSIFEVQKGFNVGWNIGQIDERKLDKIIAKPWAADGKNFSDRIWEQKSQLVNELHTQLTRTCLLGKAPDDAIKAISKKFNVTKGQAGRLVMTEQAYFHSVAQKEAFEELDVEEFEIVATLDSHTSAICQDMDGKHFPMKDYQPGVTAPPFHVWCRSVTVPYFDDEFSLGERAAKDADGNTYYVPSDMKYKDWSEKYVNDANYDKYGYMTTDAEQFERYKSVLKELSPQSLDEFKKIKYNNSEKWNNLKHQYKIVNQYKIDSGEVSVQKILDMDDKVIKEKRNNFPSSYKKSGNIAGAYIDDNETMFLAHSKIDDVTSKGFINYKGNSKVVLLQNERNFKYVDVLMPDGSTRTNTFYDTEAKLFEEFHLLLQSNEIGEITMLSERGMCESCIGVMKQFKKAHPNVKVNVVSHKKVNSNVWKYRLRK
jgi:SPP1 gp7 family putative phage head morphogenesis protein